MDPNMPILRSQVARDNLGQTQGELVETCTILTTEANELMRPIHDRMPVILDPAGEDAWLESRSSPDGLRAVLVPFASDRMEAFPVNSYVSNAKNVMWSNRLCGQTLLHCIKSANVRFLTPQNYKPCG